MKKGLAKVTAIGLCVSMLISLAGCSGGGGSASTDKAAEKAAETVTDKNIQSEAEGTQEPHRADILVLGRRAGDNREHA